MSIDQEYWIYNRYNNPALVDRCPNGYGPVRKLLNEYAIAAVNLYGVIPASELADIVNSQNPDIPQLTKKISIHAIDAGHIEAEVS